MSSEKRKVALWSLLASGVLAASKFVVGVMTGSLGIISDAIHSLLDFGATIITYMAIRVSDRPPDRTHHFGHGKIESVAALAETALLFGTTGWIVYEAISRLAAEEHPPVEVGWIAIAVIVGSIVIDYNRVRALRRVAKKYKSQALEADALNFSTDMLSSAVVLVGLGLTWLGYPQADALAAIGVAMFICIAAWRLGKRTIDALMDAAPAGAYDKIATIVREADGILGLERLRIRPVGATLFVDLDATVGRTLPLDRVAAIKSAAIDTILAAFPEADVSFTAHPVALDDETVHDKVMLIARRRALAVHHITVQHIGERLSVSFDIEVDGRMPLRAAHELADGLEKAIADELGTDVEVESHIEPLHVTTLDGRDVEETRREAYTALLSDLSQIDGRLTQVHNVRARANDHGVFVTFHCRVDPSAPVEAVHAAVDDLEYAFRQRAPEVCRVIAHAEPLPD